MAKVPFTKLGLKAKKEIKTIEINQQQIEIQQYLSIYDKLSLITDVINYSMDAVNGFTNPIKIKVYMIVGIIDYYTNIGFTEKQKENIIKLYDLVTENEIVKMIFENIPETELKEIEQGILDSVAAYDKYRTSAMGVIEALTSDYNATDLNIDELKEKITDPNMLATIKELAELSGYNQNNKQVETTMAAAE